MEQHFLKKIEQTSEGFRKLFILSFTKELIRKSKPEEIFQLEKVLTEKKQKPSQEEIVKELEDFAPSIVHKPHPKKRQFKPLPTFPKKQVPLLPPPKPLMAQMPKSPAQIPHYPFPPTIQHIRPVPTNQQIDLGKLNPLIKDPKVRTIECNGEETPVIVKGSMGTKPTRINLTKEEINEILQTISQQAKIPLHEGVTKIAFGNLILSAIISEIVGSKFIIKKMVPSTMPRY